MPIYLFASGYGLFFSLGKDNTLIVKKNGIRILKLLINFWIVLIMFMGIAFLAGKPEAFSGGFTKFLLNFFLLSNSYNGAWWYLQTYVIHVLLAPLLIKLIKRYNSISMIVLSGIIYLVSYVERIKHLLDLGDNAELIMVVNALVLVGTSQFAFVIGIIFAKERIYSKLHNKFYNMKFKNVLCLLGILLLVVLHAFYESMIIAPFTAIAFICLFNLIKKSIFMERLLTVLGNHSTNLWLTHMFIYISIFPELIFAPRYPILIFIWLIVLCLLFSFVINAIYFPILKKTVGKNVLIVDKQHDKPSEIKISG
ncbi:MULTISPECIES: acyltransferase family protein [Priestia]|uniref:Acyltransferase family protein n=1 Tax=Priestia aryabhattai TaxID=412384 RepID=A0ABD5KVP1_PRIAR|nr:MULTISPECIES: acyltransferase family protein [Priestia]MDC7764055.1 acyltransferase family protein [Priestia aryabhattai]MEB4885993.1 acyltransferase family protein [Priestia megaterium]MED5118428.1 acyltransferase family protein [Priestia megaterium]UPK48068.1 acyltransferase [Bacillus sp. H8-1]